MAMTDLTMTILIRVTTADLTSANQTIDHTVARTIDRTMTRTMIRTRSHIEDVEVISHRISGIMRRCNTVII